MELELNLNKEEQAQLMGTISTPGFKVLKKLAQFACDKHITRLLNTSMANHKEVLTNHMAAKVAAQLFTDFVNILNIEVQDVTLMIPKEDKPIDQTAGMLDLDDIESLDEEYFK